MVQIIKRSEDLSDDGKYNVIITDKNGNSFTMMVGGNLKVQEVYLMNI